MQNTWWKGIDQLAAEQSDLIDLPPDQSYLILGPPGSGKTNLLLLRAKYLTLAGHANLRVIVFTRTLQEFLSSGAAQYSYPAHRVTTSRRWATDVLYQHGVRLSIPNGFEEQRRYLLGQMQDLLVRQQLTNLFDAILLDEAQDYLPEEIAVFRQLSKIFIAVADSRQKIYPSPDCLAVLKQSVDEIRELKFHYRSGLAICRLADALAKTRLNYEPLEATAQYNELAAPSSVDYFALSSPSEEAETILQKLANQLKAYPGELLGVICPKTEDVLFIWDAIRSSALGQYAMLQQGDEFSAFDPNVPIVVSSIHSFKGLEARALHIAGLANLGRFQHQRNLIFTAVTRAKTSLSLYSAGQIPDFLAQALNSLSPQAPLPKRADVFGGGI